MFLSDRQKKISVSILAIVLIAFLVGSFNSIVTLWKSGYIEEGQSISAYNSVELDVLSTLETSYKSILPPTKTDLEKVFLYISQKNQNHLLSNLPYSSKDWVKGLILDNSEFKKINVRHRGDNPNNWLHKKKSWRVKRKKSDLKDGMRIFNYLLPRDTALINTYLGYYIAEKMNIPAPRYKFVELYINDKYQGLYLETEHIDENFLRMSNIMPVNIYKGTPSRTDKPINQDSDLFNNPFLWEKRAIFNARSPSDYYDLENLLIWTRMAVNDSLKMDSLEKLADVQVWAKFSAYETIMQSWHNYEKNNMYLISDPWMGQIYPIAFDTIFNDTKSRLQVDEPVNMDNGAHALTDVYSNNSRFIYEKYKILDELIKDDFYGDIRNEANRIYNLIRTSWKDDPSHAQFVLTNEFDRKLIFNTTMDEEVDLLLERTTFIEDHLTRKLSDQQPSFWFQKGRELQLVVNSHKPITGIKICPELKLGEIGIELTENEKFRFSGVRGKDGCYQFDLVMNANRVKPQGDKSRITTFTASNGFEIVPTNFIFDMNSDFKIKGLYTKYLGSNDYVLANNDNKLLGFSRAINNKPFQLSKIEEATVWQGNIYVNELLIIDKPIKILPGTTIRLSSNGSIIFKDRVESIGLKDNNINFIRSDKDPWGVIALIGKGTQGSVIEFTNFSGGSGGNYDGYEFTGMFSIHASNSITLSNLRFSENAQYDDLIHILYSNNIKLSDSYIFDGRADLIDIDISEMEITDCIFNNSGNDAIDAMTSNVLISNTYISESGDKGLSAGESSTVSVSNLTFDNTQIAIQSKDGTYVSVSDSKFLNNKLQLDAYQKNWRYGDGGRIEVDNSLFESDENLITAQKRSRITVSNSYFNTSYSHLQNKRVNFVDNQITN